MLLPGYCLRRGTGIDRARLVQAMQRTYQELYPGENFPHLAQTVDQYFSSETSLWWVDLVDKNPDSQPASIACLWIGTAIDQITGWQYPHVFLLYVSPEHRRQGIGSALMRHAETWARARGDRQMGLQVFQHNLPALRLYEKLGYQTQSLWMVKPIEPLQN